MQKMEATLNQDGSPQKSWGGRRRFTMTLEEEREFLADWEAKALAGAVQSVFPIHSALEKRLGRDIILSTTYRILERHGWKKVYPDARHLKSIFPGRKIKKHPTRLWMPPYENHGNKTPDNAKFHRDIQSGYAPTQ
jgi:hypothetical protein